MRKILVAGAGHGGLSAAAILAKNGFDVTVIEKSERDKIGHDWHDTMDIPAFSFADIPVPAEECFTRGMFMCYMNPKKTVKLNTVMSSEEAAVSDFITIDRKFLINYLIKHCEDCGVSFIFGEEITEAVCKNNRVIGLKAEKGGEIHTFSADMIIDAAGMNSPVRRSLPENMGIQKEIPEEETFEIYRAYYENTNKIITSPVFSVFFYNCKKQGLDWVITDEKYIDILIGKFGSLSSEEIDTSLEDLRKSYPGMGSSPIRGGTISKIPLSKTLPMLVADSYALTGDSASMTVPLNGSGIDLSIQSGKLLATAVMAAEKSGYKKEALWQYQYRYFTLFGNSLIPISILRRFLGAITAEDIDFFLEKGILTEKEINMAAGNFSMVDASYVIDKLIAAAPQIKLLPKLAKTVKSLPKLPLIYKTLPSEWDEEKIKKWLKLYTSL